ncbi:hypothetical protein KR018_002713, partial [Drosophila ironensis]
KMQSGKCALVFSLLLQLAVGANILAIFPYRIASPFLAVRPLIRALIERGHNLTLISPLNTLEEIKGARYIGVPELNQQMQGESSLKCKWSEGLLSATILYNVSYAILSNDGVQRIMRDPTERFDMVLMEASHLDALYGLSEYFNATLVGICTVTTSWNVDYLAGNFAPSIYEPISPMGYALDNSLWSMWNNWMYITEEKLLEQLVYRPGQVKVARKFLNYSAEKLKALRARFSVLLINSHFSMGKPRSNVPNIIEVGGLHLSETPEPCGEELQRFLDEAEHGVIYFSMGMEILIRYLPDNMQEPLLQTFAQLKQRVVWKSDLSTMAGKSDNVFVISHAPQRAILAHPNTRLFITHGGLLSVIEAIHSGVPMLGLPFYFDQFGNLHRVESAGMARVLDSSSLNTKSLSSAIGEMINNPKYARKAKEMSLRFKDRPMSPLDTAIWWTEYALRHRNVSHIRMDEEEIPFMRYYRLDSLISWGLRFGFVVGSILLLIFKLYKKNRDKRRWYQKRFPHAMQ